MSSIVYETSATFTLDGLTAMARGLRVRPDANGNLQPASAAEQAIGTLAVDALLGATHAAAELFNPARYMVASGVIAGFADYDRDAAGKIKAVGGGTARGITMQASTANNDRIICIPYS